MRPFKSSISASGGGTKSLVPLNQHIPSFNVTVVLNVKTGTTGDFSVQYTVEDPWGEYPNSFDQDAYWINGTIQNAETDSTETLTSPATAVRVVTADGDRTADFLVLQSGITE